MFRHDIFHCPLVKLISFVFTRIQNIPLSILSFIQLCNMDTIKAICYTESDLRLAIK